MPALALDTNALPNGGIVVKGDAQLDYSRANELHIQQNTDRAIINWKRFNIGENATTEFHQNSSSSIAVNRVTGAGLDPTQILGTLKANGQVVVLDRNGVIFGKNSVVDVGGIVASTGNIDDAAFMRGDKNLRITGADQAGITLNGQISVADAGLAAFVAPTVVNNGIIKAKMGKVQLAGATSATLDLYGDGLIEVTVDGDEAKTFVSNSGIIAAEGGVVALTASAAKKVVDSTVNMSGIISVGSATEDGGKIVLSAEGVNAVQGNLAADKGQKTGFSTTIVSGYLDAAATGSGKRGGKIEATGDGVGVLSGVRIDASGDAGGGDIKIGGDYLGTGITSASLFTYVDENSFILNDAIKAGDGGRTIVWSDGNTAFYGNIFARGGADSGNGGFAETSGHHMLDAKGYVDLTAKNGEKGTYLLDPTNIAIYGNFDPTFVSSDSSVDLGSNLKLWLDPSNYSRVLLSYEYTNATAQGTVGTNTLTVDIVSNLMVGSRIRLGGYGASGVAATTMGPDTYTITAINGTTITLAENLTANYNTGAYVSRISQLTDQSGLGNDATQVNLPYMPIFITNAQNGLAMADFYSGFQSLVLPNLMAGATEGSAFFTAISQLATPFDQTKTGNVLGEWGSNWQSGHYPWIDGSIYDDFGSTDRQNVGVPSTPFNVLHTYSVISEPNSWRNYMNGESVYQTGTNTVSWGSTPKIGADANSFFYQGRVGDVIAYSKGVSDNELNLINQYQSTKWGTALHNLSASAEASMAMDGTTGYSAFTTRYLEKLSQTANVSLVASNNITLDLQGDTLNLANNRNITLNAGNDITNLSAGEIKTNGTGNISFISGNDISLTSGMVLEAAGGGNISLDAGNAVNVANNSDMKTYSAGKATYTVNGMLTYDSSAPPTPPQAIPSGKTNVLPQAALSTVIHNTANVHAIGSNADPLESYANSSLLVEYSSEEPSVFADKP